MFEAVTSVFSPVDDSLLIVGDFDPLLVVISVCLAVLASFMAMQVSTQAALTTEPVKRRALTLVGSVTLGGGVWSMHFLGMLAFSLCTPVTYNWLITALSFIPSIGASWVALSIIIKDQVSAKHLMVGGVLMGAGIGTMHYVGMAAMEMAPLLRYDIGMFLLSIVVAVLLAILSLWIRFSLTFLDKVKFGEHYRNGISAVIMGLAISGMHYTGMAAARFVRPPGFEFSQQDKYISHYLGFSVAFITVGIIVLVLAINMVIKYKESTRRAKFNEAKLRATINTSVDGVLGFDRHGIIESANDALCDLLGWSDHELIGQDVRILMPNERIAEFNQYLDMRLSGTHPDKTNKGRDTTIYQKNGRLIPIRLAIGFVELGQESNFVAFISDLRYRVEMERALRQSEAQFRSLISNIPGIAYRCVDNEERPMVFISDAIESISGYPASDYVGTPPKRYFHEHVHPDDIEETVAKVNGQHLYKVEYRIYNAKGEIRWLLGYGTHAENTETGEKWLDGFIMDITERKEMEQSLLIAKDKAEQAAASRAAFLANMSHEIRTPMNAVIGFSDILLDDVFEAEQRKHLTTINQSAKSLLHLLNDILDSAKLDKGKFELEMRDFSLIEEVDAVVSTLWLQANKKELYLNVSVAPEVAGAFHGAPDRIRQVLTNLVGNAIKFTVLGGVDIKVGVKPSGCIEFSIIDTGIGMTPEQLAVVFDAFGQADASMSRRFGGTGLGTTISKQLIELMGGKISATSTYGEGSCFSFSLPLAPPKCEVSTVKQKQKCTLPPLDILIVDDIQQNIDLLTLLMTRQGHNIVTARDGKQALVRMRNDKIDVVLMDVQMPIMDGLTSSRERRKEEQSQQLTHIPIIALTASVLAEDRQAAIDAGMDGFANKPVDIDLLNVEIAQALGVDLTCEIEPVEANDNSDSHIVNERKGVLMWGDRVTLLKEIALFVNNNETTILGLKDALENPDWSAIQAQLHTLKGLSGNLSLTQLSQLLSDAERCAMLSSVDSIKKVYSTIEDAFSVVKNYITAHSEKTDLLSSGDTADVEAKDSMSTEQLLVLVELLIKSAQNNEYNEDAADSLVAGASKVNLERCKRIQEALDDFEFEDAVRELQLLKEHALS
ncbi:Sensory/regulatory protein RpfC [Paraglaciecola mesophila]|uniref:histidine kinase n=1 Tax=Paraglaciecola mesophila TaxID=197222 RepID=A0A857JFJ8_9ALTE|nr:MHYT domain-containing protein [Paraglaciecola mesophila]QHJ10446.1 Sensory/regulatory protein RpfC [Paraglaciecola mesophila]